MTREAPSGYHWEWCVDEGWKVGGDGRRCRMKGCQNQAVAALKRGHHGALKGFAWWHYCALHLYGRKIEDGVVKSERLVENDDTNFGPDWVRRKVEESERGFGRKS